MDLEPNGDEQQVIDATADFLAGAMPLERFRSANEGRFDETTRTQLAELGWFGMGVAEAAGGFGFSAIEETLVFREIGRHLGPTAVLPIALAAKLAAEAGDLALARDIASGGHSVAFAVNDPNREASLLFDWHGADLALCVDGDDARLVSLAGIDVEPGACLDRSVGLGRANLDEARSLVSAPRALTERSGRLFTAAMLVGIAEAVTDMIAEYAKIRFTFGKAIGSYQAVRHPISDMKTRAFAARQQLFLAAVSCRDETSDAAMQSTGAKLLANDAAMANVDANIQLHGGIATTDEHDAHYFMKRANVLVRLFGAKTAADDLNNMAFAA
ncbi:acyl-CoA dehydrogenase family protein [Sphingopyxis sp.]|uniref:acyl-CoA dehydrogenase family protein n=1 Tax=Sphingopyxis sp. TaxID=1908224 RepID=UPI003D6CA436